LNRDFVLDLDFSAVFDRSWQVDAKALDFLIVAATVYAVDKIVPRDKANDRWTRVLNVTLPVQHVAEWNAAKDSLQDAISFLTGDTWNLTFSQANRPFQSRRTNRRKSPLGFPKTPVISLLSGGLDSFVGALDLLKKYPNQRLLFVSHYDRHVTGPAADQDRLRIFLAQKFIGCINHFQVRVGVIESDQNNVAENGKHNFERTFRSRSLIFLALGVYAASRVGDDIPIIIPENGPVALNLPLNPSRRGSCSTRTVHPFFLARIAKALESAGIPNPITNIFELKTKGELISDCAFPKLLQSAYSLTNSCAKAGRKTHWKNRKAKACGTCFPCILRRASLHANNLDNEEFGNDVLAGPPEKYRDFHALLGLLCSKPSPVEIKKLLLANGRLPMAKLDNYSSLIERFIVEVSQWITAKATKKARVTAGLK
jgi:7-cyano-7-deazaguanine synthase in queuosine biosynthesis